MVVGNVGSGKSSVLSAIIGQMERVAGKVVVGGRVAYVAQTAWIINDSVQVRLAGWLVCGWRGRLRSWWGCSWFQGVGSWRCRCPEQDES
jgi:ABC-type Mn2+/Zn2+ transport system ATPase subunit